MRNADLAFYVNDCQVRGREDQHDPMVFKFSFMHHEEPSDGEAPANGAAEHIAAVAPEIPSYDQWEHEIVKGAAAIDHDGVPEVEEGAVAIDHDGVPEVEEGAVAIDPDGVPDLEAGKNTFCTFSLEPDNASERSVEEGDWDFDAEHEDVEEDGGWDELACITQALAKSLSHMRAIRSDFQTPEGTVECLDAAAMKPIIGTCSPREMKELKWTVELFLSRHPYHETSLIPKENTKKARIFKSEDELTRSWNKIFEWRRKYEPEDREPIYCQWVLCDMWKTWQDDFYAKSLSHAQIKNHARARAASGTHT